MPCHVVAVGMTQQSMLLHGVPVLPRDRALLINRYSSRRLAKPNQSIPMQGCVGVQAISVTPQDRALTASLKGRTYPDIVAALLGIGWASNLDLGSRGRSLEKLLL